MINCKAIKEDMYCGKKCLKFQHSGGKGRRITEIQANLYYKVSSRISRDTPRNPFLRIKQNKTN